MSDLFFRLPLELRQAVYSAFATPQPISHPISGVGITSVTHRPPPLSLLLVCKQVCTEALEYFYAVSTWKIVLSHAFNFYRIDPTLSNLAASPQFRHLRRFELVYFCDILLLKEYPSFGIDRFCEVIQERSRRACEVLEQAPQLSKVAVSWIDDTGTGAWEKKAETLKPLRLLRGKASFEVGTVIGPVEVDREMFEQALVEQVSALEI